MASKFKVGDRVRLIGYDLEFIVTLVSEMGLGWVELQIDVDEKDLEKVEDDETH